MASYLKLFSTQDHIGVEISKPYSSYSFHPIPAKLHEDTGYGGIQAVTLQGNRPNVKNFVSLWNFNMRVNGRSIKCVIWKRFVVEWNGWEFGTHWTAYVTPYVGYFSCLILWVEVGSFGTLCKISDVKISKDHFSHSFRQVSTKRHGNMVIRGEPSLLHVLEILQIKKKMWCWKFC